MRVANFYSPKHGVGCTTTALLFALAQNKPVTFIEFDQPGDVRRIAGVSPDAEYIDRVRLADFDQLTTQVEGGWMVVDWGVNIPDTVIGNTLLVTDCSYVTLSRWPGLHAEGMPQPDSLVILQETGTALGPRDVQAVIQARTNTVTIIPKDMVMRRTIDAGLLTSSDRLARRNMFAALRGES